MLPYTIIPLPPHDHTSPRFQVREAAVRSVSLLLSRLPYFSRQYYSVVEEMLLTLSEDDSEAVVAAVGQRLMPVLQV